MWERDGRNEPGSGEVNSPSQPPLLDWPHSHSPLRTPMAERAHTHTLCNREVYGSVAGSDERAGCLRERQAGAHGGRTVRNGEVKSRNGQGEGGERGRIRRMALGMGWALS